MRTEGSTYQRRIHPDEGSQDALEQPLGKATEPLGRGQRAGEGDSAAQDAERPQEDLPKESISTG